MTTNLCIFEEIQNELSKLAKERTFFTDSKSFTRDCIYTFSVQWHCPRA